MRKFRALLVSTSALEVRPKSPNLQGWWGEIALGAPLSGRFRLGCVEIPATVGHQTPCSPTAFSRCHFSAALLVGHAGNKGWWASASAIVGVDGGGEWPPSRTSRCAR